MGEQSSRCTTQCVFIMYVAGGPIVAHLRLDYHRYLRHHILHPRQVIVRMRMAVVIEAAGLLPDVA